MLQSKYPMNAPGIIATTIDDSLSEYPVRLDYVEINKILMQARWYDEVEFLVVTAGSIKVQCGDDTYVVEAGDALLFAPGLLHITRPADTKQETYMYRILFSPNFLFNYDEPYLMQKYCYPLLNSPDFKVHSFTRARPEDHKILDYLSQVIEVNFHPIFAYELLPDPYLDAPFSADRIFFCCRSKAHCPQYRQCPYEGCPVLYPAALCGASYFRADRRKYPHQQKRMLQML